MIAEKAGVNKALIYYYFKDKNDIVKSLFDTAIEKLHKRISLDGKIGPYENFQDKIRGVLDFLDDKKKILSVMLMESLKGDDQNNYFFQCAESVIRHSTNACLESGKDNGSSAQEMQRYLVHEFFTGFIPIIAFSVFQDKWTDYFHCNPDQLKEYFIDEFVATHLAGQGPPGANP
jgi:AcrR family transcriptional regulator